ncbi:DUF1801 domain-containing protein [Salmonirosea aquatica]|uniref:YdhG-like domain-containing protein n=1 Tax=Salmonirosea aquatica TaxID=2654236 RepID=A0A7C9FPW8_9BACT|nr:hypothetical protein [Cytophagaceae bacterium SJW1-29]
MAKDIHDSKSVTALIQTLDPDFGRMVEEVRQIVLSSSEMIGEQIKWNSPSFFYTGEMKPFNPKEYKRDMAVMNLRKGRVLLIFPTGATIEDTSSLLKGTYTDGRRIIRFDDLDEVKKKAFEVQVILVKCIDLIEQ